MKKKKIQVAGGELEIEAFETSFEDQADLTVEQFNRKLAEEERYDEHLAEIAAEIAAKLSMALRTERAVRYWEVGDLLLRYRREVESREDDPAPYDFFQRGLERILQRLEEHLTGLAESDRESYSVPYLLKWYRMRKLMTREQADRPILYPFYHELIYKDLATEDIDDFLDRCEAGEFPSNVELRAAVKDFRAKKRAAQSAHGDVDVMGD